MKNAKQQKPTPRKAAPAAKAKKAAKPVSAGTRFSSGPKAKAAPKTRKATRSVSAKPAHAKVTSSYASAQRASSRGSLAGLVAILAVIAALVVFVVLPVVSSTKRPGEPADGQAVEISIPDGSSGDAIAQILSENHVIDDPKEYYAAVDKMGASSSIKPGEYALETHMNPDDVVEQLVNGPNIAGNSVTVAEGLTVDQTAAAVEQALGIPTDEFLEQAKASNYVDDYPFLDGAYNDSLEGYLYPKTYRFDTPEDATADAVIRAMLDQFETETASLNLADGANGLSEHELVAMASLIERETAVEDERPLVASVIYNRLDADMPLQIDAAIVYARGGGNQTVTYDDLEIDSPYNVYQNTGLTPGPICSPSLSSLEAAVHPADTDYLYYVVNDLDAGTHSFSDNDEQFEKDRQRYNEMLEESGQ